MKQREEQILDLYKRNLEDEKKVFGGEDLTQIETRLTELKETLFDLAQKRRQKQEDVNAYRFQGDDEDENVKLSRRDQLFNKLNQKYKDDAPRGGKPEMTEEEKFWAEKEK